MAFLWKGLRNNIYNKNALEMVFIIKKAMEMIFTIKMH